MTEHWPDGVLSLQTEQEGRGEVLDILHAHHVITSNIKMMSSCKYIPSQSVLLLFIWSFREAVKIENISHFFFYFDSFLYKRFSFDWNLWMNTSDFYFSWLSLWDLVIDGPMFVLLKMGTTEIKKSNEKAQYMVIYNISPSSIKDSQHLIVSYFALHCCPDPRVEEQSGTR